MRWQGDKAEIAEAIVSAAVAAYPGVLEREDLDREPAIARADGRTVTGVLRHLANAGCITPVEVDMLTGRVLRLRATAAAAVSVAAVRRTLELA